MFTCTYVYINIHTFTCCIYIYIHGQKKTFSTCFSDQQKPQLTLTFPTWHLGNFINAETFCHKGHSLGDDGIMATAKMVRQKVKGFQKQKIKYGSLRMPQQRGEF